MMANEITQHLNSENGFNLSSSSLVMCLPGDLENSFSLEL